MGVADIGGIPVVVGVGPTVDIICILSVHTKNTHLVGQ